MPRENDLPFTYDDFQQFERQYNEGSEGGVSGWRYSGRGENDWNELPPEQRWSNIGGAFFLPDGDERNKEWWARVGPEGMEQRGHIVFLPGSPDDYLSQWGFTRDRAFIDPDRIHEGNGWFAMAQENLTPEFREQYDLDDTLLKQFLTTAALIAAGAYFAPPGAPVDPFAAAPGQGFGTALGTGTAAPGVAATTVADATANAGADPSSFSAPPNGTTTPTPGLTGEGNAPGWATEGGAPVTPGGGAPAGSGAVQPPAPVTNAAPPVPGTSPGAGIVNTARNAGVGSWYSNLSPLSRAALNLGIGQGASALMGAHRQREAEQAAEERDERAREDRVRRGTIPAFGNAFTPKPGIIGSRRGG